jgi:hypothetical protein
MNENNPKVALTNEQRETLAGTLDIFAEALRERRELRVRDFQDLADEVRHFQQSPNPSHLDPDDPLDRGRAKLKVGDEALFEPEFPFFEATLEETQRRVWVCSVRYIIIGIQGDTFTAECLIGQPVVWAHENVVRLGR